MKRLTILRHAKSGPAKPGMADFDRSLDARGRQAARRLGAELKRRGLEFDHVIASPAVRVRETVQELAGAMGRTLSVAFEPSIYEASPSDLLRAMREIPDSAATPLLVGHNPGLHELALDLTRDDPGEHRQRIMGSFPTTALVIVSLQAETWSDVGPASGKIVELILAPDPRLEN